jgi:hypothetical protein
MKLWCFLQSAFLLIFLKLAAPYTWLDDAQTIRFTVVDLKVRLQPLETPLQGRTLDNFIVSLRVFLESSLNVKPTTVYNLQVAVGDQTPGMLPENGEVISYESSKDHWIEVDMQVLIEYEKEAQFAATGESDMEGRIRALFQDQWSDLLVVLQLLDRPVFNDVERIALETQATPDDSRLGPMLSSVNPEVIDENPALSFIVILVVVAIGVAVLLAIAVPLFLMSKRDRVR